MADLEISSLPPLAQADVSGTDPLAVADLSASETKRLTIADLFAAALGTSIVPDDSILGTKLKSDSVDGSKLTANTVDARKLMGSSVPERGGITIAQGVLELVQPSPPILRHSSTGALYHGPSGIAAGRYCAVTVDAAGHVVEGEPLEAADLPAATADARGGVRPGPGLSMTGDQLGHASSITPVTISGLTLNAQGHVTAAVPLVGDDLPAPSGTERGAIVPGDGLDVSGDVLDLQPATGTVLGGVIVGPSLQVDGTGVVGLPAIGASGTWAKVEVDTQGRVIQGLALEAGDIPALDASRITTGTFGTDRLAVNSVTAEQLADYGIAQVSQTRPKPEFAGQWWINPTDRSAFIWLGTVDGPGTTENGYWMSLGFGSVTEQNARFGGTYNATTNLVQSVNSLGVSAGITPGQALPGPASANQGVYLLVVTAGTGVTPAPTETLAIGDWVLSNGSGTSWVKVGVISAQAGVVRDDDVLTAGTDFSPAMPGVATQAGANALLWSLTQVASGGLRGTVKPSTEVLVAADGAMTLGTVDEGTY